MYQCKCGKQFSNPQALHGHQSMCRINLGEDRWKSRTKISSDTMTKTKSEQRRQLCLRKEQELAIWISEHHRCEVCGEIMTEKYASGRFCSVKCSKSYSALSNNEQRIKKLSEATHRSIEEGRHNTWSRNHNKGNYIERYWNFVLSKVFHLETELQHPVNCEEIRNHNHYYFLDILVNGFIDLEIDGDFHDPSHDKVRDEFLTSQGYVVYRVPYINPRKKKDEVLEQIKEFVEFVNKVTDGK